MTYMENYLDRLDQLTSRNNAEYTSFRTIKDNERTSGISTAYYNAYPQPGYSLSVTAGLSKYQNPEWLNFSPELLLLIDAEDKRWSEFLCELTEMLLGKTNFEHGTMINIGDRLQGMSNMDCILIYKCSVFEVGDEVLHLGEKTIRLSQVYLIHDNEKEKINKNIADFFSLDVDWYAAYRSPVP